MESKRNNQKYINPKVNMNNLTYQQRLNVGPRFVFPSFIDEYETFFNPIHSFIDEDGQIIQIDSNGENVPRGNCFKPGSMMLRLTN